MRRAGLQLSIAIAVIALAGAVAPALGLPDARYYTYDEVCALIDNWAAQYPNIFHREIIGYTLVGHEPIWACKISDHPGEHEPEARLFFHAAQHSNEANGTGAIVYTIDRLLSRYGHQSYYTNMVDNLEMWFIPILNVDGHRMSFGDSPDWEWWRKTKRDNDGNGLYTEPEDGVDPNRNWDFRWAEYDSSMYWSTRYKGPYPFSEPEVVTIRDFTLRERPVFVMDYHSPDTPADANKIWWAWYDPSTGQSGPDANIYRPISIALGNRTQTETNGVYYNGNVASYNEVPKEQCWIYANTEICIYVMEISRQFWWTGATVDTIAQRVARGSFYLMERALSGPGLNGIVTDALTGAPLEAQIRITQVYDPTIGPFMSEGYNGSYWRLLLSGNYNVSVSAEHHYTQNTSVYVNASGWTRRDFQLQPDPTAVEVGELTQPRMLWADTPLAAGRAVHFTLDAPSRVWLDLFDAGGRQVANLLAADCPAGARAVPLPENVPSGSYLLLLRADGRQLTRKVLVVR